MSARVEIAVEQERDVAGAVVAPGGGQGACRAARGRGATQRGCRSVCVVPSVGPEAATTTHSPNQRMER